MPHMIKVKKYDKKQNTRDVDKFFEYFFKLAKWGFWAFCCFLLFPLSIMVLFPMVVVKVSQGTKSPKIHQHWLTYELWLTEMKSNQKRVRKNCIKFMPCPSLRPNQFCLFQIFLTGPKYLFSLDMIRVLIKFRVWFTKNYKMNNF